MTFFNSFLTLNKDGIWCNYCHELLRAAFEFDDEEDMHDAANGLECCPKCGADEDGPDC